MSAPVVDEGDFETALGIIKDKDSELSGRFEKALRKELAALSIDTLAMVHLSNDKTLIADAGKYPELLINDVYFVTLYIRRLGAEGSPATMYVLDFTAKNLHLVDLSPKTLN